MFLNGRFDQAIGGGYTQAILYVDAGVLNTIEVVAECRWLLTFNVRDFRTERVRVSQPGPFLEPLRGILLAQGS